MPMQTRRVLCDLCAVLGLFVAVLALLRACRVRSAQYPLAVYVHVLVCNILLESQKPAWARLCALDPAPETFYALLLRLVLEFAACALVGFYAS